MMRLASLAALAAGLAFASAATAQVTTYSDRTSFTAAAGSLTTETFSSCPGTTTNFSGSVSSTTGPCSGIVPGITFSPSSSGQLYIAGPGQSSNPTTALGVNFPSGSADIVALDTAIYAFGADLFQNLGGGSQGSADLAFTISLYGTADVLLGTYTLLVSPNGGDCFGVTSLQPIYRITIAQPSGFAVIDDVSFSTLVGGVPEPATWAMMLLGFGGIGMTIRRGRKSALQQIA